MTSETILSAFQMARPRGQDLPAKPVKPVKRKAAPGTTRVMDVNGRLGPKLAPNGSQGFAIEQSSLTPEERAANRALADSRADLANQLSRAGVRYPIPAPKAPKASGKKNPAGVVAPRRKSLTQLSNEDYMQSTPITGANYMANANNPQVPMIFVGDVAPAPQAFPKTSIELLALVNQIRAEFGESHVRHNDFVTRCKDELGDSDYETFVIAPPERGGRPIEAIRMTPDQCKLVAMRESKGVRRRVLSRLNALDSKPIAVPQTFSQALMLAAQQAEKIEQQQAQLQLAAPKVAFVERYVEATGLKGFREVCKLLKANEARFREFVIDAKIMYRLAGVLTAHQNHIDAGRFEVRTGVADTTEHAYTATKFTPKGIDWIAVEWAKHQERQEVAA